MMRGRVWPAQIPRPSRQQYQFPPTAESWCSISPSTPPVPTPLGPSPFASARPPPARVPESRAAPALGGWRLMDLQELAKIPPYHGCARHEKRPAFFRRVEKTGPATARAGTLAPSYQLRPFTAREEAILPSTGGRSEVRGLEIAVEKRVSPKGEFLPLLSRPHPSSICWEPLERLSLC